MLAKDMALIIVSVTYTDKPKEVSYDKQYNQLGPVLATGTASVVGPIIVMAAMPTIVEAGGECGSLIASVAYKQLHKKKVEDVELNDIQPPKKRKLNS